MKKLVALLVLFAFCIPAFADFGWVEGSDVRYVGGTANGFAPDTMGHLDTSSPAELVFMSANGKINIPYEAITKFNYREEVAHHYGVVAATVIGLLKARRQQHFLDIAFTDTTGNTQTVVLEVSKDAQAPLRATIQARMSHEARRAS
jgi:hypothetical protein